MTAEENRYVSYTQDLYNAIMLFQQKVDIVVDSMSTMEGHLEEFKDCEYGKEKFKELIEKCQAIVIRHESF